MNRVTHALQGCEVGQGFSTPWSWIVFANVYLHVVLTCV